MNLIYKVELDMNINEILTKKLKECPKKKYFEEL